jgi:hypothetical protein
LSQDLQISLVARVTRSVMDRHIISPDGMLENLTDKHSNMVSGGIARTGRETDTNSGVSYLSRTLTYLLCTFSYRKRPLSRFRAVPSHVFAVLREFVSATSFEMLRVSGTVRNPSLHHRRTARRPTDELRVRRFIIGPE